MLYPNQNLPRFVWFAVKCPCSLVVMTILCGLISPGFLDPVSADQPLQVFILAGQSNMQGHARVSTLDVMRLSQESKSLLDELQNEDGSFRIVDDVWISSIGSSKDELTGKLTVGYGAEIGGPKIGPELTFGISMHEKLNQPILIIKTAWGGKSLHTDFRPPSAGPYVFSENQLAAFRKQGKNPSKIKADKVEATGHYYRLMIHHVQAVLSDIKRVYPDYDSDQGFELAGFVWFQGWNDMVDRGTYPNRGQPEGYQAYSDVLSDFIRDVRRDLEAPQLPFVIGVMGVGGPIDKYSPQKQRYKSIHGNFRNAMAAPASLPEFRGNVVAVMTEDYWDMELENLRRKDDQLKQKAKEARKNENLTPQQEKTLLERLRAEAFTLREQEILLKGVSNFEFHYLGSGRIMARIGRGFAEALAELMAD
jgi:FtsZ-binding cell division protein ZapB